MKRALLDKAQGRMRSAHRAAEGMLKGEDVAAVADHWVDFLMAWKSAYQFVEDAATDTPQERTWFARVNAERKSDELLQYLFEARNEEEHGIDFSALPVLRGSIAIGIKTGKAHFLKRDKDGTITALDENREPLTRHVQPLAAGVYLKAVPARGNRIIPAPTKHLGDDMKPMALEAAVAGLNYLEKLVGVAEAMHTP